MNGQLKGMQLLIEKGADINARNKQDLTPLHIAVSKGHIKIIELLVSKEADTNIKDERGRTAIQLAERHKSFPDIIRILKRQFNH